MQYSCINYLANEIKKSKAAIKNTTQSSLKFSHFYKNHKLKVRSLLIVKKK